MAIDIDSLKASLRILDTGDAAIDAQTDALLTGYLTAAKSYVQSAVGADEDFFQSADNEPLYQVAVLALATAYYQNPAAIGTGNVTEVNLVLNNIVGQLRARWKGDDDDGTTSQPGTAGPTSGAGDGEGSTEPESDAGTNISSTAANAGGKMEPDNQPTVSNPRD